MFSFFKDKFIFIADYDANIGNLSEKAFYILHKAKRENKKILFVKKKLFFKLLFRKIKYKQLDGLYHIESPYLYKNSIITQTLSVFFGLRFSIHVLYRSLLYIFKIIKPFSFNLLGIGFKNIINIESKEIFSQESADKVDWGEIYNSKLEITFSEKDNTECESVLKELGVNSNDWYVCLHIRTSFFHDDPNSEYRNSSPTNYTKMINYINNLGGKVIRLGDNVPMPINNICIDYPNSNYKSEIMDLYLIKNCKFYIGTNSGILDTAFLFGTPVLGVNFSDFCLTKAFKNYDRILYKTIIDKKTNKKLTISEIFSQPMYVNPNLNEDYLNKFFEHYEIQENTETELYSAVREMIDNLERPSEKNEMDKEFDTLVRNAILRWIEEEDDYMNQNIEQAYRFYQRTYSNGRVCQFQLNENL